MPAQDVGARPGAPGTSEIANDLVTVVIPARNEEHSIGECLRSIQAQTERNLQIIVVDGGSDDGTADVVRGYAKADPRIELIGDRQRSIPSSLNTALAHARGRWFVRVDAHSTIPSDYVSRAVTHLRTGRWGGVGGRKDGAGVTAAGRAIAAAMASRFGVGNSVYHHGSEIQTVDHIPFGAYPIDLVRHLGGWDERLLANEDFEFDYRLTRTGRDLLFDPSLAISWKNRQSIRDLFSQYRRYGRAKVAVLRLHPESARPRHLAVPAFVLFSAGAAVAALRRPRAAAVAMAPYAVGLAAASVATSRRVDPAARPFVPAAFAAMHFGWGVGFWEGVVSMSWTALSERIHSRSRQRLDRP